MLKLTFLACNWIVDDWLLKRKMSEFLIHGIISPYFSKRFLHNYQHLNPRLYSVINQLLSNNKKFLQNLAFVRIYKSRPNARLSKVFLKIHFWKYILTTVHFWLLMITSLHASVHWDLTSYLINEAWELILKWFLHDDNADHCVFVLKKYTAFPRSLFEILFCLLPRNDWLLGSETKCLTEQTIPSWMGIFGNLVCFFERGYPKSSGKILKNSSQNSFVTKLLPVKWIKMSWNELIY
jgi:hypothetical protein